MTDTNASLFPAGTFTPDPRPNAVPKMLAAQFGLDRYADVISRSSLE